MATITDTRDGTSIDFQFLVEGYDFRTGPDGTAETFALLCAWADRHRLADALLDAAYWDADGKLVRRLPTPLPSLACLPTAYADQPLPALTPGTAPANPGTLFVTEVEAVAGARPIDLDADALPRHEKAKVTVRQTALPYSVLPYDDFPALLGFDDALLTTDVYFRNETTYLLRYLSRACGRGDLTVSLRPGQAYLWYFYDAVDRRYFVRRAAAGESPQWRRVLADAALLGPAGFVEVGEETLVERRSEQALMTNSIDLKIPFAEYALTWHKVPSRTLEGHHLTEHWASFLGKVNAEVFDGHEPGTLLLTGVHLAPGRFFDGGPYADVTFHLRQLDRKHAWGITDSPAEGAGHNWFFRVDGQHKFQVQKATHDGRATGRALYPPAYFYRLFQEP